MERICQLTDLYWSSKIWDGVVRATKESRPVSEYIKRLNLKRDPRMNPRSATYSDTLIETYEAEESEAAELTELRAETERLKTRLAAAEAEAASFRRDAEAAEDANRENADETEAFNLTLEVRKFWGFGFSDDDYITLEYLYAEWIEDYGDPPDKTTKELYKSLCYMQMQLQKAVQKGDNITTLTNSFRNTLKSAGLKPIKVIEEEKKAAEARIEEQAAKQAAREAATAAAKDGAFIASEAKLSPFGVFIEMIENYTPAEFYKDKHIYKDWDNIGDYIERFIFRPMRNAFFSLEENDREYAVTYEDMNRSDSAFTDFKDDGDDGFIEREISDADGTYGKNKASKQRPKSGAETAADE